MRFSPFSTASSPFSRDRAAKDRGNHPEIIISKKKKREINKQRSQGSSSRSRVSSLKTGTTGATETASNSLRTGTTSASRSTSLKTGSTSASRSASSGTGITSLSRSASINGSELGRSNKSKNVPVRTGSGLRRRVNTHSSLSSDSRQKRKSSSLYSGVTRITQDTQDNSYRSEDHKGLSRGRYDLKNDENSLLDADNRSEKPQYADLYQYDAFPAIDRVPTAIGFKSFDSDDEQDLEEDARYNIDIKGARAEVRKLLQIESFDSDADDKYANMGPMIINPVVSDDSDSCPAQWRSFDDENEDWYDELEQKPKGKKKEKKRKKKKQRHKLKGDKSIDNSSLNSSIHDKNEDEGDAKDPFLLPEDNVKKLRKRMSGKDELKRKSGKNSEDEEAEGDYDYDYDYDDEETSLGIRTEKSDFSSSRMGQRQQKYKSKLKASKVRRGEESRFRSDESTIDPSVDDSQYTSMIKSVATGDSDESTSSIAKLEDAVQKESLQIRAADRARAAELTELDEYSITKHDNNVDCVKLGMGALMLGVKPLSFLGLWGRKVIKEEEEVLDSIQLQRLVDETKFASARPRPEAILNDLTNPAVERIELQRRKRRQALRQEKEVLRQEKEREQLRRKDEGKTKLQEQARHQEELIRDRRKLPTQRTAKEGIQDGSEYLQEAPALDGNKKSKKLVMDITDMKLNLSMDGDDPHTQPANREEPKKSEKEDLPLSTIEIPSLFDEQEADDADVGVRPEKEWNTQKKRRVQTDGDGMQNLDGSLDELSRSAERQQGRPWSTDPSAEGSFFSRKKKEHQRKGFIKRLIPGGRK